ncbi:MAG TPA: hypothetical protein VH479_22970, partial [Acidimicrobiales bacterium]
MALVFFVLVTAFVVIDRRAAAAVGESASAGDPARRPAGGPLLVTLTVLALVAGVAATARVVPVGDAGARVTWGDVGAPDDDAGGAR